MFFNNFLNRYFNKMKTKNEKQFLSFSLLGCFLFLLLAFSLNAAPEKQWICSEFELTATEWNSMIKELPSPIAEKIRKNTQEFLSHAALILKQPKEYTLLVDKNHPLPDPKNYEPEDLQLLSNFPHLKKTENPLPHRLIRSALLGYVVMEEAARKEGIELIVCSTYRTYDYQKRLNHTYQKAPKSDDFTTYSALPGHSQHHLGTTIDFYPISEKFAYSKAGKWLSKNAHRYGFSLSFPEGESDKTGYIYEPWHYRYVGTQVSHLLHYYFDDNQQLFMEWWDGVKERFAQKRR